MYEKMLTSNYENARKVSDELQARYTAAEAADEKLHAKLIKALEKTAKMKAELDKYLAGQEAKAARREATGAAHADVVASMGVPADDNRLHKVVDLVGNRPDIIAASANLAFLLGVKRELGRLESNLRDGESVVMLDRGHKDNESTDGLIVLTDKRVVFLISKWTGDETTDIALSSISSLSADGTLINRLTITTSGQVIALVGLANAKGFVAKARELMSNAAPATAQLSSMDELRKAADLHAAGILSADEFNALKARLLNR